MSDQPRDDDSLYPMQPHETPDDDWLSDAALPDDTEPLPLNREAHELPTRRINSVPGGSVDDSGDADDEPIVSVVGGEDDYDSAGYDPAGDYGDYNPAGYDGDYAPAQDYDAAEYDADTGDEWSAPTPAAGMDAVRGAGEYDDGYDYRAAYPDDEDLPPSYNPDAAFSAPPVTPPLYGAGAYDPAAPPRMARKRIEARRRRDSALYLPWWSLLLLLAAVAFFAAILILGMNLFGGQSSPEVETPLVIVVTSTPTRIATTPPPPTPTFDFTNVTPGGTPGAAGTAAVGADSTAAGGAGAGSGPGATEAAASALPPSATPLALSIGATVEVFDVDTSGLNVRDDVGLAAEVLFIASDGSQFEIIAGPEEANDFTWWQIRETGGATAREGWAVADFLRVVAAE